MAKVDDPARLAALRSTALLDAPADASFDRLTRLASRLTGAPAAAVTLLDEGRQFLLSLAGPVAMEPIQRETPLSHSFCTHVVDREQPLVIDDARNHPLVCDHLAVRDYGVRAYLGVPLVFRGQVLGALCASDAAPRHWTDEDVATVRDLAASVVTEIELRAWVAALHEREQRFRTLADNASDLMRVFTLDSKMSYCSPSSERLLGYTRKKCSRSHVTGFSSTKKWSTWRVRSRKPCGTACRVSRSAIGCA